MWKNEIETIEKYYKTNKEKFVALRGLMNSMKILANRCTCPTCNQKLDEQIDSDNINQINKIVEKYCKLMRLENKEYKEKMKPIWEEKAKKKEDYRKKCLEYISLNKNKMNRSIRDYNNPKNDKFLPNIPKNDRKLWNDSLEIHLDNRDIDEIEELYFDLI